MLPLQPIREARFDSGVEEKTYSTPQEGTDHSTPTTKRSHAVKVGDI